MLYREIMAVCSEIHTKHINTVCGRNVEGLTVKPGGTYSDHWALQAEQHALDTAQNTLSLAHCQITTNIGPHVFNAHADFGKWLTN
jgi:hypothetical protein